MPLQKVILKPGVNRENTRYTNEGGWYESEKIRFRQGTPEKLGGWVRISPNTYTGVCRSLWNWTTLTGANLLGVGTSNKFYIENTGAYYDITPISSTSTLGANPISTNGTTTVTITDNSYNPQVGDFVIFNGATAVSGITISGEYEVKTVPTGTTYTITSATAASGTATGGGSAVYASYLLHIGTSTNSSFAGWGGNAWNTGNWGGLGYASNATLAIWSQWNFGQDLVFGPKLGKLYYWNATPAVNLAVPTQVTITNASPAVVTLANNTTTPIIDNTAIMLQTTATLPLPLKPYTVYYAKYLTSTTFNLATSTTASATLTGVTITGTAGQFSCTASSVTLAIGHSITISGTYGGTGSISGYTNPTKYYIIATDGGSTFTLSTTAGGSGVTTTAGTPTGLTYTLSTTLNTSTAGSGTHTLSARGIAVADLAGASSVPIEQSTILVSDSSRFTMCFGANPYGSTTYDPMTIRWSNQESVVEWAPAVTNQAGEIQLSHGSLIVSVLQSRQEVLVWTDAALYSLQYLGPPYVWGNQLLSDNISIASMNAASYASGVSYWMGKDKFYKYDGRVQTLRCDLRQYIYSDINRTQFDQVFSGTNEGFNEVWWFYCSEGSTAIDKYVIYNYAEDLWYYGSMARTAWLDTALRDYPIAATYVNNLVYHEFGVDDSTTGTSVPIEASITSAQYDIGDGHNFAFVYRMLPDLTFRGSTEGTTPSVTMYLQGLNNSGSGITQTGNAGVNYSGSAPSVINVDEYTGQIYIRIRGRQMQMKLTSNTLGTQWQLGAPRIDVRPDGRR